jgi:pimeloyl-ACP methyl ester carboxylesterase
MKYHDFNQRSDLTLVNLAYANGFPPETYTVALRPLFEHYHVVSLHARPLWGDCEPESLTNWAQFGDDLLAGLDTLTPNPVIGIGHSVGAIATLYAAAKHPDRFSRLVLLDPTLLSPPIVTIIFVLRLLGREPRFRLAEGALRRRRTWDSVDAAYDYFRSKRLFVRWPDRVLRNYAESITTPGDDGQVHLNYSPEWEARIYNTIATDVWGLLRRVRLPMLVIRGAESEPFTPLSLLTFRLIKPSVPVITLREAGHLLPQEQPEAVGKLIGEFLARNPPAKSASEKG